MFCKTVFTCVSLLFIASGCVNAAAHHYDPKLKIIGGETTRAHSARYVVYLTYKDPKNPGSVAACTGSLLSNQWVVTSKSCLAVTKTGVDVYIGAHDIKTQGKGEVRVNVPNANFKVHPDVDLAVIKLPSPVTLGRNIGKVTPIKKADAQKNMLMQEGTAYGWGATNDKGEIPSVLKQVSVKVITNAKCNEELKKQGVTPVNKSKFCTTGVNKKGTCKGDSGGPFMINGVQVGVILTGPPKCEASDPSIYLKLGLYLDWIEKSTGLKFP